MKLKHRFAITAALVLAAASASAQWKINEIDSDTPNDPSTDYNEFIEILGPPNTAGTGLVLVWYNGGGTAGAAPTGVYRTTDLDSYVTDANGIMLLGTSTVVPTPQTPFLPGNTLQNGEDALALYVGEPADFPTNAKPYDTTLPVVDKIIYETGADASPNWGTFADTVYDENAIVGDGDILSLQRIPNGTGAFIVGPPTPGVANDAVGSWAYTGSAQFRRHNQTMAVLPTTRTITLRNTAIRPLNVSAFGLDASTSSVFTIVNGPDPAVPCTLAYNKSTTVVVQFVETDVSVNKVYGGAVNATTDDPTSPSKSCPLYAELVLGAAGTPGAVKINEICYVPSKTYYPPEVGTTVTVNYDWNGDGATSGQYDEFIELYNTTAAPILIEGWEQRSVDQDNPTGFNSIVFPIGATIEPNGFVVVFSGGTPTGFTNAYAFYNSARFRNAPYGAFESLKDGTGAQIDAIAYLLAQDSPDADGFLNTGISASNDGGSYGRVPDGEDTFAAFRPNIPQLPTPGSTNAPTVAANWMLFE